MRCLRCSRQNLPHQKFCGECGTPLQHLDGTTPPAPSYGDLQHSLITARDQQATTSEILRAIASSPSDLEPAFAIIASNALRLCAGVASFVFRYDGTLIHLAASDSADGIDLQVIRDNFPVPPERATFASRVVTKARSLSIAD